MAGWKTDVDHVAYSYDPFLLLGPYRDDEVLTLPLEPSAHQVPAGWEKATLGGGSSNCRMRLCTWKMSWLSTTGPSTRSRGWNGLCERPAAMAPSSELRSDRSKGAP